MKQLNDLSKMLHREGYMFVIICIVATFIFSKMNVHLGWLALIATAGCVYFFRNPDRMTPIGENLIISPADGLITSITNSKPPQELNIGEEEMNKISIFLNILDVHVNRIPIDGKIESLHYNPGKFLNASLDKSSIHNERQSIIIETKKDKKKIVVVQIAGVIARRIVCDVEEGNEVQTGQRYGIIRFGSRVDIYLPLKDTTIFVSKGQRVIGGETMLANLENSQEINITKFLVR